MAKRMKSKRGGGAKKGSKFERTMAREFSEWWTYGRDPDIFWRSQGSGSRATTRFRKSGTISKGQVGDLSCAQGSCIFTDEVVVSMKKGAHQGADLQDLLDMQPRATNRVLESWLQEMPELCQQANADFFMLIFCRDHRRPVAIMHYDIWVMGLKDILMERSAVPPMIITYKGLHLACMPLSYFFETIHPAKLCAFLTEHVNTKNQYNHAPKLPETSEAGS